MQTQPLSILTLSGQKEIMVIDIIALSNSKKLDHILTKIFSNQKSDMVTMESQKSLTVIRKELSGLQTFLSHIPNLICVPDFYDGLLGKKAESLKSMCTHLFGKDRKLCQKEA